MSYPKNPAGQWVVVGGVFLLCTGGIGRVLIRHIRGRRNYLLGYLGERAVGEQLSHMEQAGFRVFHDIPAENNGKKFNIDHVVVGPTGTGWTRRRTKRNGLPIG